MNRPTCGAPVSQVETTYRFRILERFRYLQHAKESVTTADTPQHAFETGRAFTTDDTSDVGQLELVLAFDAVNLDLLAVQQLDLWADVTTGRRLVM